MIFEKVRDALVEELGISPDDVKPESDLVADIGADSLDVVQLIIRMEREFGIRFSDDDMKCVKTIGDVVNFIEKNAK